MDGSFNVKRVPQGSESNASSYVNWECGEDISSDGGSMYRRVIDKESDGSSTFFKRIDDGSVSDASYMVRVGDSKKSTVRRIDTNVQYLDSDNSVDTDSVNRF